MQRLQTKQDELFTLSYMTLRQAIGCLGFLMPLAVRVGAYVFDGVSFELSISAYYYTSMREVFVTTLVLVGALLACYRTPDRRDTWVATIAGFAAIGVAWFPMNPVIPESNGFGASNAGPALCGVNPALLGYHNAFVATFFSLAFYLVYFRFSAHTPAVPTAEKLRRNRFYKGCGAAMLASFVTIGLLSFFKDASIFWPESLAVVSFAVAWLVKGQLFLKDQVG